MTIYMELAPIAEAVRFIELSIYPDAPALCTLQQPVREIMDAFLNWGIGQTKLPRECMELEFEFTITHLVSEAVAIFQERYPHCKAYKAMVCDVSGAILIYH